MKKILVLAGALVATWTSTAQVFVTGAATNQANVAPAGVPTVILGLDAPLPDQTVTVAGPIPPGMSSGFSFNPGFGTQVGFVAFLGNEFFAVFTNQFGTNVVSLPATATNLNALTGRLPLSTVATQAVTTVGTDVVVPSATPVVDAPPPTIPDEVPRVSAPPVLPPPTLAPTGRETTVLPTSPVLPPPGVPAPSPTPIPPAGTPAPSPTPIPPAGVPVPR